MKDDTVDTAEHRRQLSGVLLLDVLGRRHRAARRQQSPTPTTGRTIRWSATAASPSLFLWTVFSVLFLIAGIGLLAWHYAVYHGKEGPLTPPANDPLQGLVLTPSMKATAKYFWVVLALFLVQILLGAITAHYQVEGQDALRLRAGRDPALLADAHLAHAAGGAVDRHRLARHRPVHRAGDFRATNRSSSALGVNFLFVCLLIIVVGAFAGQWFAVMQKLGLANNFWFGHQGWEYVDIGRFWQWFLFVGLMLWLLLMGRALWPALRRKDEMTSIVGLLFLSTVAIGLFYGAGLMWGEHTHLSMVEYWRWWVVHLWVEGFFEVFAIAVMAFLFVKLGLVRGKTATVNVLFATIVFMAGGVLGTFHHLYFAGTTTAVVALGASFSALEVVPLAFIGFEAYETWSHSQATPWMARYRWPIMFFIAVSFWNLVGAGLFGFLINPPLALYYMQGLNLTPLHGHTALFGVYGMLGIGLMLFCLRGLKPRCAVE